VWEIGFLGHLSSIGVGCGSPALVSEGGNVPRLGATQVTRVLNVPGAFSAMSIGFSAASLGAFPLPLSMDGFGLTGCWLYHDAAYSVFDACSMPVAGNCQHSIVIPADLSLLGLRFYMQAWADAPGVNPAGIVMSNGLELVVGDL